MIFFIALVLQGAHHLEHVTQIFQWWYLGLLPPMSKGIVFFLDLEWNHFIFDTSLFFALVLGSLFLARKLWKSGHSIDRFGGTLLISALLIQGWHAVEHTVRIVRHVDTGCEPCRGIIDSVYGIPLIPLHFWFNVFALTLPLLAFVWYGMDVKVWEMIRGFFRRKRPAQRTRVAIRSSLRLSRS
jgi:hypothetical protein